MSRLPAISGARIGRQYPAPSLKKRMYAAAKQSRLTGGWMPVNQGVNDIIRVSAPTLRARTRQLVRDFPYFQRAVNIHIDYTVGDQMNYQARVANIDGKGRSVFDRRANQQIEDAIKRWSDECDVSGKLSYDEMRQLIKRQDVECGEALIIDTNLRDPKRFIPFALQMFEADWLTDLYTKVASKNEVDQGIEYDPLTGRVVAYHFADPKNLINPARIPAEYVRHGFETLRPGQLRGVSPFTTAILIANDINDYIGATIDTAKLAARYLALVTTADPGGFQRGRAADGDGEDEGKKIEELENAIIEYLRPGEKVEFAKNEAPGQTFEPFVKFISRILAIATGTSHELLTGDYSGLNYSNLKIIRADLIKQFRRPFSRHVRQFDRPIICNVIEQAVMAGRIDLPGYWRNPHHYWKGEFIQPGVESPDRLRDSKADTTEMQNLTRSPQEICASRGRYYEDVLDEIKEAKQMAEDRGLNLQDVSTALANNPAKLGAEEEQETDDGKEEK